MTLLELAMDTLTLALALRLGGRRLRPGRILLGSLLGTTAAAIVRGFSLSRTQQALFWLPIAALMSLTAGGNARRPLTGALLVLSSAGLLGGLVLALSGALGSLPAAYALGSGCAAFTAVKAARARHTRRRTLSVLVRYRGRQAVFDALLDSGNSLRDYLTGLPVIVLPENKGRDQLGLEGAALRPIVAKTAGGDQLMWCFVPEKALVLQGGARDTVRAVVALSPGLAEETPALLPSALLETLDITALHGATIR